MSARANLAASCGQAGRPREAIELLERVLADRERPLGEDHPRHRERAPNSLRMERAGVASQSGEQAEPTRQFWVIRLVLENLLVAGPTAVQSQGGRPG
ncbi:tetratricopeptide repeat protein [Streptomyces sp. YIM 132580]|uniref:tetratricopeptide repeat protein n=1 Tax=Streptomyces sp. YIM 132580 TaxID=2691958 RepID=UPI003FCCE23E